MTTKEKWKYIEGYEGRYSVSTLGNVMSFLHDKISGKLLKPKIFYGYRYVSIRKDNAYKMFRIPRLVAGAFLKKGKLHTQVNHKNGKHSDDRVENLEWCTASENIRHAIKTGLKKRGYHGRFV